MKILGQDSNGRIVVDGEGDTIFTDIGIPADSPMFMANFNIDTNHPEEVVRFDEYLRETDRKPT